MSLFRLPLMLCLSVAALSADAREAQVGLPEDFTATPEVHRAEGFSPRRFQQPLRIGPYSARIQAGGDTRSGAFGVGRVSLRSGERIHAFVLATLSQALINVECIGSARTLGERDEDGGWEIDLGAVSGPVLECELRRSEDDPGRRLVLAAQARGLYGTVESPWGVMHVKPLYGYAGSRWRSVEPTGFAVAGDAGTLMVVDVLNAGRVLLDPALDARHKAWLAAVAAALMLSPAVEPG